MNFFFFNIWFCTHFETENAGHTKFQAANREKKKKKILKRVGNYKLRRAHARCPVASNASPGKTQHVGPALWEHAEPQPVVRFYLSRLEECSLALAERTQTQNSAARALVAPGPHEGVKQRESIF